MNQKDELSIEFSGTELTARQRLVAHYIVEAIKTPDEDKTVPTTAETDTVTTSEVKRPCEAIDWSKQLYRDLRQLYEAGIICSAKRSFKWGDGSGAARKPGAIALQDNVNVEMIKEYVAISPTKYWDVHGENDPETAEEAIKAVKELQRRVDELEEELNEVKAVKRGAMALAEDATEALDEAADAQKVEELEERLDEIERRANKNTAAISDPDDFIFD